MLISHNIGAYMCNRNQIIDLLESKKPKLLLCQEISQSPNELKNLKGYKVFFKQRINRKGGGIGTWVSETEEAVPVPEISFFDQGVYESLAVELPLKKRLILNFYRIPGSNYETFFENLERQLQYASRRQLKLIGGGDANMNMLTKSPARSRLEELLAKYNCSQLVSKFTRPRSRTLIDIIITSGNKTRFRAHTDYTTGLSDHASNELWEKRLKDMSMGPKDEDKALFVYNFKEENLTNCKERLDKMNWFKWEKELTSPSEMLLSLTQMLTNIVKENCQRKIRITKRNNPWFTQELHKLKMKCSRLQSKQAIKFCEDRERVFKEAKALYRREIRISKQKYYENKFVSAEKDSRKMWQIINEICARGPRKKINHVKYNDKLYLGQSLADQFNSYFKDVPTKQREKLQAPKRNHMDFMEKTCGR